MRAVRFHSFGPPEVLTEENLPLPAPGLGEVLIRVVAAGVNPIDAQLRAGLLRNFRPVTLPFLPGSEASGHVEAAPPGSPFQEGQSVFGITRGSYAEYAVAAVADLQHKPTNLGFDEAAAIPQGLLTAWAALEEAAVSRGQRVLIQGAAGVVGRFAVRLAVRRGALVWGTCSEANLALLAADGASPIDYGLSRWGGPPEFDVVIDAVGGAVLARSFGLVNKGGTVLSLADPNVAGAPETIQARFVRRRPASDLVRFLPDLEEGTLLPLIRARLPLEQAAEAHRLLEAGHGTGRIVLRSAL